MQVKVKSLSEAVGLSWDRLGGPSGLVGLSLGKAKSLSQAGLALSLNPGWVRWVRGLTGLGQLGQDRPG
jgi:hypothetical protein